MMVCDDVYVKPALMMIRRRGGVLRIVSGGVSGL